MICDIRDDSELVFREAGYCWERGRKTCNLGDPERGRSSRGRLGEAT